MEQPSLRVLDVNFNRAREALRVLEDYARLVLDDGPLSARIKAVRHDLTPISSLLLPPGALSERDIQHDVGSNITTGAELSRQDTVHVATAAAKRAGEALRCIEEYGKIVSPVAAAKVEQLRYQIYAIEQEALVGGPRRSALRKARLHVLITESLCRRPWREVCRAALEGGADILQLREKSLTDRELRERAMFIRELTASHDALFIMNDRPDIARLSDADGVHVGQTDLSVADARQVAGHARLIGKSTHSLNELRAGLAEQPDYIAVGPMFASPTKPAIGVSGTALLGSAAKIIDRPLVAIGGINAGNARQLWEFGKPQLAVCQAVIAADDPQKAVQELRALLDA